MPDDRLSWAACTVACVALLLSLGWWIGPGACDLIEVYGERARPPAAKTCWQGKCDPTCCGTNPDGVSCCCLHPPHGCSCPGGPPSEADDHDG